MSKKAKNLCITLLQTDIVWEDKAKNIAQYTAALAGIKGQKEIVVLPEMFTTGFSMNPTDLAEDMEGTTIAWMRDIAQAHKIILCGSLIIKEEGNFYNRLVWMQPNGQYYSYDKRHLFAFAGEDEPYTAGDKKIIVQVNGWRICPLICYDLRFPVWARNIEQHGEPLYDVLLYVANWPSKRTVAWKTLLQARAIENQCYCVGVNRVGIDGKEIPYEGASSVFGPLGELIWQQVGEVAIQTIVLDQEHLAEVRRNLPFLKDGDSFLLR
ncbi:MAG: amidohydrolase [Bacteroidetes bacterium]|nr:amidohydrolase [Bacteroidota bacterium]